MHFGCVFGLELDLHQYCFKSRNFPHFEHISFVCIQILRAILNKRIYPQSSSPKATTAKKYLQNRQFYMTDSEDEMLNKANEGSKWVKTDSECELLIHAY